MRSEHPAGASPQWPVRTESPADRMVRHLVPDGYQEIWRDPTSSVAIVEIPVHAAWISKPVRALEEATGARIAYLMRFDATVAGNVHTGDASHYLPSVPFPVSSPASSCAWGCYK